MSTPRSRSTPLSIYVVFHPKSKECRALAHSLHAWFRLSAEDGDCTETGLPIWFRSQLDATKSEFHPAIGWSDAACNVVVVLCDRQLVADPRYRHALERLVEAARPSAGETWTSLVLPVEVHRCMHQLTFLTAQRNSMRLGYASDAFENGVPETSPEFRARARQLRRLVTEAVVRDLQAERAADGHWQRLSVFVSHAKGDGLQIAERLRDSLAQFGQLQVWFDENDLPWGERWSEPMREQVAKSAGFLAVVTDLYATRPWCRLEATTARSPVPIGKVGTRASVWKVVPGVAVQHHAAAWSKTMAPLVHVPGIGWPQVAADEAVRDRIADIVDRLLLEMLLATFYRRRAQSLREDDAMQRGGRHVAVLTWVPEPWSLAQVLGGILRQASNGTRLREILVAYPGHGLRAQELAELEAWIDQVVVAPRRAAGKQLRVRLQTQETLELALEAPDGKERGVVCISGAGHDEELEAAGVGLPHVDDFLLRLARRLLSMGWQLAYGGSLEPRYANLTESLIGAARGWVRASNSKGDRSRSAADLDRAPFVNYSPWPDDVPLRYSADLVGMARFERVLPPGFDDLAQLEGVDRKVPQGRFLAAEAMRRMRWETSDPARARVRIVMAGKVAEFSDWMPGIAEELLCALQRGQLPVVLGAFGGCAGLLTDFLADSSAPWPQELTFEARRHDARSKSLLDYEGAPAIAVERYRELEGEVRRFRDELHGKRGTEWRWPEIDRKRLLELMQPTGPSLLLQRIVQLLDKVEVVPPANGARGR
jgi:hypothetical protein